MKEQREGFRSFMQAALAEARGAALRGEVPVGAVVVSGDRVLARAGNRTRELADPTAHAEMLAIRAACAAVGSMLPSFKIPAPVPPVSISSGFSSVT